MQNCNKLENNASWTISIWGRLIIKCSEKNNANFSNKTNFSVDIITRVFSQINLSSNLRRKLKDEH